MDPNDQNNGDQNPQAPTGDNQGVPPVPPVSEPIQGPPPASEPEPEPAPEPEPEAPAGNGMDGELPPPPPVEEGGGGPSGPPTTP